MLTHRIPMVLILPYLSEERIYTGYHEYIG